MKKIFNFILYRYRRIFRYSLLAITAGLIIFLLPRASSFDYNFEVGKPWQYDDLIAPFSFPIKKSDETLAKEKEELLTNFVPYFRYLKGVSETKIEEYRELFGTTFSRWNEEREANRADSMLHFNAGLQILSTIYDAGLAEIPEGVIPPSGELFLLENNVARKRHVDNIYDFEKSFNDIQRRVTQRNDLKFKSRLANFVESQLSYNIIYDDSINKVFQAELLEGISHTQGLVQEGEIVINRGTIVTKEKYQALLSLEEKYEEVAIGPQSVWWMISGQALVISVLFILLGFYLRNFEQDLFWNMRKFLFVIFTVFLMYLMVKGLVDSELPILYAIPFCIVPIVYRTLFGVGSALFVFAVVLVLTSFLIPYDFEFILLQLLAGTVAVFANHQFRLWSEIFKANLFIWSTYMVVYFGLSLMQKGGLVGIEYVNFGWLSLSVLLTLIAYPLVNVVERIFGFVSDITLIELTDINKPLLKDLSIKAPGTFQHTLQVANLSEAAAFEVEANHLLVKAGSLYHDIGKGETPEYFIENQQGGINPHNELPPMESAEVIIRHVTAGVEKAQKAGLPEQIIDFITTHHGTTKVEYFYRKHIKDNQEGREDYEKFMYPGPKPYSKETAIVMMADTVEAATRSLPNPTPDDIDNLVDNLIQDKIAHDQFASCDISFKDITKIKQIFKKMLKSIHHSRIQYPPKEEVANPINKAEE